MNVQNQPHVKMTERRWSRLVESVLPSSVQYQDTLHRVTDYFVAQGNSLLQAQRQAIQGYDDYEG